jgi:hypothetical protein
MIGKRQWEYAEDRAEVILFSAGEGGRPFRRERIKALVDRVHLDFDYF